MDYGLTHNSLCGITYFLNVFSTISFNNIEDPCDVGFSPKWPARPWRIVHIEFTVSETLMPFNHKPSTTSYRSTLHKLQDVCWCDSRCSTMFNNVTLLRP